MGETESLHSSVAISDCDGLVRGFCVDSYPRVCVCVISRAKRLRALIIYQNCPAGSPSPRIQHINAAELRALAKLTLLFKDEKYSHERLSQYRRPDALRLHGGRSRQPVLTNSPREHP